MTISLPQSIHVHINFSFVFYRVRMTGLLVSGVMTKLIHVALY